MPFNPKVSIVIPVYNGSRYLAEAIDSALGQTYRNIEVVVVNDGSQDDGKTEAVARSYGGRIRYFSKKNGWVASALNMGIKEMQGEYFSWLSHDDVYYSHKIESQVALLAQTRKDIALYCDFDIIDSESRFIKTFPLTHYEPWQFRYALTVTSPIHGCTALIPRAAFDRAGLFDERLRTTQDYDLWFKIAKTTDFVHTSDVLIKSRAHEGQGINALKPLHLKECNNLVIKFLDALEPREIIANTKRPLALSYVKMALEIKNMGFSTAAKHALKKAVLAVPRQSWPDNKETISKSIQHVKHGINYISRILKG